MKDSHETVHLLWQQLNVIFKALFVEFESIIKLDARSARLYSEFIHNIKKKLWNRSIY